MLAYAPPAATTRRYAVEVSGWDSSECFFVENADLLWNEETGKRVVLARKLREHSILFVRLLQQGLAERSHPVVYEAQLVGRTLSGRNEFVLHPLAPKPRERESVLAPR